MEHRARTLEALAQRTVRAERTWQLNAPLSDARNAHRANTVRELRRALRSRRNFNWLEGDVRRRDDGRVVLAHDREDVVRALDIDTWLRIGALSQRGLKFDIKDDAAIPALVEALVRSGIAQERLMVNVGGRTKVELVRSVRERLPACWVAVTPFVGADGTYDDRATNAAIEQARVSGERTAFCLRWDIATDDAIRALAPYGRISIWTSHDRRRPHHTRAEIARLRARGVDGVIDLGTRIGHVLSLGAHALRLVIRRIAAWLAPADADSR